MSYPLSPMQHGMLFHWLRGGAHTGVDVVQMVAALRENLDEGAMARAWTRVIERHPVLRTRFRWEGEAEPVQQVLARVELSIAKHSFHDVSPAEQAARFDELLREDRLRGIALDEAPLFRVALVSLDTGDHRLVWTFSHALLDDVSLVRIVGEVFAFYEAFCEGRAYAPGVLPPYRDHIAWLGEEIAKKRERAASFFQTMLAGFTTPTPLPMSAPDASPPRGPHILGEERLHISREVTLALRALGDAHRISLRTWVEGAWALVLGAHAGEDDVVFGATRECRHTGLPGASEMLGMFVNTLPVRVRIANEAKVLAWLEDLGASQAALRDFEHTPLVDVQAASALPRGVALFDSVVVFREALVDTVLRAQGGRQNDRRFWTLEQTSFPLTLFVHAEPELVLEIAYDPAHLDARTIQRLLAQLSTILTAMARDPEQEVGAIPRLHEEERRKVLVEWNETKAPYAADRCIHTLIEEQVARSPESTALVFRDASMTYRELDARASALAHRLRDLGVGPDVLVGIYVERSLEMVVGLLAILKAGGAYVPLDPSYPKERLAWMLEDTKAPVVVTQARLTASLPPHRATIVELDTAPPTLDGANTPLRSGASSDNLAYVIFTSGSSGRPKGVMVRHRNVTNFFSGMDALLGEDRPGVWLALTSISFDISVLELFWTLARGFRVVVQEESTPLAAVKRREMGFSLFYFAADAGDAPEDKYRLLLEGAKFADEHGFMAVWTPERHFHAFGGLYPNPSVTSAAIAATTKRIQIRAGSIVLPLHNPIRVAEEWSLVDNLSGGRVGLSFASGWHANDFALLPENYQDRKEIMARGIDTVRRLWRGESVSAKSGNGNDIAVRIFPAPVQKEPPIWVTASYNPETFELAGRIGANVLTNLLGQSISDLRAKLALYRAARRRAGHAGEGHVTLMLHTFVGADVDAVREKVRRPFTEYLKTSTDLVKQARWAFPSFAQPGKERAGDATRAAEEIDLTPEELDTMMAHAFERYFQTSGLFGTPDTCIAMVETLKEIGVDEIACLIDFGVPAGDVMEGLDYLDRLRERSAPRTEADGGEWDIPAQIRRHGVTHMQCTPTLARLLASSEDTLAALAPLQKLLLGGEALPPALAKELGEVVAGDIVNMYGPTETTVWSTAKVIQARGERVTIGRPIANTEVYVLDRHGSPVPIGAAGELFIGGAGVARGYLGHPDLTRERFAPSPFCKGPEARLYRTGDLVRYLPDGDLEFLGRVDQQIKLRGHRIELGEIEAALGEHATVLESVAVLREDAPGNERIVAYVAPRGGLDDTERFAQELREHLQARLPGYMVPSALEILDALPRTPNGKLDRKALPAPDRRPSAAPYIAPANELEERIVAVWAELLNVERVGAHDNPFDLGANSLLMIQANGKLRQVLGKSLSLVEMFRFPTASALAAHLGSARDETASLKASRDRARTRNDAMLKRRQLRGRAA